MTSIGGFIGNLRYTAVSSSLNINVPVLGQVNVGSLFPDLGKEIGANVGGLIGQQIENTLTGLPIVGGLFGKLLG